jgi:hypothetical protein
MGKKNPIDEILLRIQRYPDVAEHQRVRRIVDLLMQESGPFEIAEDELDCLLSAYQWDAAAIFENGCLRVGFQPRVKPMPSAWERDAVLALMSANPYLIRRCTGNSGMCKGLFYATRTNNTTCCRACISARYDSDPVKYQARLETQRANHTVEKDRQDADAKRALLSGHIRKRTRSDHKVATDSEAWLRDAGGLGYFTDKETEKVVRGAVNRASGANRKMVLTVVPNAPWIASDELNRKSSPPASASQGVAPRKKV